jgi:hypothetical protein
MSQRIADASAKVARSFQPIATGAACLALRPIFFAAREAGCSPQQRRRLAAVAAGFWGSAAFAQHSCFPRARQDRAERMIHFNCLDLDSWWDSQTSRFCAAKIAARLRANH